MVWQPDTHSRLREEDPAKPLPTSESGLEDPSDSMSHGVIRVLLAEDDEDDYILVRTLLSQIASPRHDLKWVSSYRHALAALETGLYDVCLLDYRLGNRTGLEILREANDRGCKAAFILFTGRGDYGVDMEAMKSGASDYLDKTQVTVPLLERSIRYALERRHLREELEERIRERTAELAEANAALKESVEKIKVFAYAVSHDLRSPSVAVHGLAKRLREHYREVLDEKGRSTCDQIMKAAGHIAALADNINVYIRTKEAPISIEPVDLTEIFRLVKEEFSCHLQERRITWLEPARLRAVHADRVCMIRVLRNLVENALKYGGDGLSEIEIGFRETESHYHIYVRDDGAGLQGEDPEKLFALFARKAKPGDVGGMGLGLAIVKEIAERHGGSVFAEGSSPKGACIHFSISKNPAAGRWPVKQ